MRTDAFPRNRNVFVTSGCRDIRRPKSLRQTRQWSQECIWDVNVPHSMQRQTNIQTIALKKCLENAKKQNIALRPLKEGKRSLRNITQTTNVDKSIHSRISKFLRENNNIGLQKMLNPFTVRGRTDYTDERRRGDDIPVSHFRGKRGFTSIRVRMRQSDRDAAAEILNIAINVQNASLMVQWIKTLITNQKTDNSIFMNLHPVRSASVPDWKELHCHPELQRSTLRSEKCWQNAETWWRKIKQGRGKQKSKDHRLAEQLAKRAERSIQKE